jgi:hypothetical protein
MTDKEKLLALLASFGIEPYLNNGDYSHYKTVGAVSEVTLLAQSGGVEGYSNFFTEFTFDKDGKFVNVGIWE